MLSFQGEDRGRASRGQGGRQEGQDGGGAPADAGRRPPPGQVAAHGQGLFVLESERTNRRTENFTSRSTSIPRPDRL